jgi:uroporphyrinogen-III synthase
VMVTRADQQSAALARALEEHGAGGVICPVIEIEPIEVEPERLRLDRYDWLVLTSANGVDRLFQLGSLAERGSPPHLKVAAIGPQTAARLAEHGVRSAIVPERYVAEDLAEALAKVIEPGARVLVARAAGARDVLAQRLTEHGARVDVVETYRAVAPAGLRRRLAERLTGVDMVTFTSSSTVRYFVDALDGALSSAMLVACIGPVTAQTASDLGLRVDIIAQEYTARGLVDAIVRSRTSVSA